MSLAVNLQDLATRVATECKSLRTLIDGNAGNLAGLNTTQKANLVAAVNELKAGLDALANATSINDTSTTTATTWSSSKINTQITSAINGVLSGAPAALDTLNELATALGNDANFAGTITTALGLRVRVDTALQGLTGTQQSNARTNIDAASGTGVGDTTTNFVTVFEAGLT